MDPLCCFEEVFRIIFQQQKDPATNEIAGTPAILRENMHNYPIFQHLCQFSDLVDENNQLVANASYSVQYPPMMMPQTYN